MICISRTRACHSPAIHSSSKDECWAAELAIIHWSGLRRDSRRIGDHGPLLHGSPPQVTDMMDVHRSHDHMEDPW